MEVLVAALDTLTGDFLEDRPADAAAYTQRLQTYPETHPSLAVRLRCWISPGPPPPAARSTHGRRLGQP